MVKAEAALKDADAETPTGKHLLIVEAATRVFLDFGYGAASMDAIAAEAGVSKQTVYSHFGAKEALFEAIIEVKCDELMAPGSLKLVPGQDHAETLAGVARRFLTTVLADPNSALFRVVIAESVRFPELAEAFYRAGPTTATETLAGYLAELGGQGVLAIADATASAKLFFAMLRGDLYMRRLLGLTPEPPAADIEAVVDEAVTAFLAAYARV
ncbi:MAG: TetR/AcrR family transcriptional regulator [Proteobacteria bacterium]|nr:TetR/AcrR family transcriptional regulator [Pseudomonadota bacterium]